MVPLLYGVGIGREDVLLRKLVARRVCQSCRRNYNLAHIMEGALRMPAILPKVSGICDTCGGALIQRPDDELVRTSEVSLLNLHLNLIRARAYATLPLSRWR